MLFFFCLFSNGRSRTVNFGAMVEPEQHAFGVMVDQEQYAFDALVDQEQEGKSLKNPTCKS